MADTTPYRNPSLSVDKRTEDLLSRMTLEEKTGQLLQLDARQDPVRDLREKHCGSFLHCIDQDTIPLQRIATEQTRLGIPLLFAIDAIHGHSFFRGATIFPTPLGLASSWAPELLRVVGRVTAAEVAASGIHWTFPPVICLARDCRGGRIGETFGEVPRLIGDLAEAST